jgi:hypothetical protein
MKKPIVLSVSLLLAMFLAACSSSTPRSASPKENANSTAPDFEMPIETQLMVATVKLDETAYPIDSEQAAELLPLWKALRSLTSSETAAQAEVEAVIHAIQDGMTADQTAAMEAMDLTMQDFAGVAEILGIETGIGGGFGEISPEMQTTMEAARESGEGPREGFGPPEGFGGGIGGGQGPGGGQGFGGAEGITPEMRETAMAERGEGFGRGFRINTALLDGVIAFLVQK